MVKYVTCKPTGNWKVVWFLFIPVLKLEMRETKSDGAEKIVWKLASRLDMRVFIDSGFK